MKEIIKISEFLRTGKFGSVEIQDTESVVIEKLGHPDGSIRLSKPLKGIHYESYEFVFDNSGLRSIQNDRYDPKYPELMEYFNDRIQIDSEFLKADRIKTLREIEAELKRHKISYSLIDYLERKALKTESGIVIDFTDEKWDDANGLTKINDVKNYELIGIRYHPKAEI